MEKVILYQYKSLKLGLTAQTCDGRIIVGYTTPDTSANISLSIGETILAVNGVPVKSLDQLKENTLASCSKTSYVELIVEYPTGDMLKNQVRNQLAAAQREESRIFYVISDDVKKFVSSGIDAIKDCSEPVPILVENEVKEKNVSTNRKVVEAKPAKKSKSDSKDSTRKSVVGKSLLGGWLAPKSPSKKKESGLVIKDTIEEHDIPTEWNSQLFVKLPPRKDKENEKKVNPTKSPSSIKTPS